MSLWSVSTWWTPVLDFARYLTAKWPDLPRLLHIRPTAWHSPGRNAWPQSQKWHCVLPWPVARVACFSSPSACYEQGPEWVGLNLDRCAAPLASITRSTSWDPEIYLTCLAVDSAARHALMHFESISPHMRSNSSCRVACGSPLMIWSLNRVSCKQIPQPLTQLFQRCQKFVKALTILLHAMRKD